MRMLASLPGRHGVPALRPAAMHSTRPRSPATGSVLSLPALEALTRKGPATFLNVQVQTLTKRAKCVCIQHSNTDTIKKICFCFSDGSEDCVGAGCAHRNCSWTEWGPWESCSRSCGVGQQHRLRTFISPGTNGSWCEDILEGNLEHRFCNIRPCRGGST